MTAQVPTPPQPAEETPQAPQETPPAVPSPGPASPAAEEAPAAGDGPQTSPVGDGAGVPAGDEDVAALRAELDQVKAALAERMAATPSIPQGPAPEPDPEFSLAAFMQSTLR